MIDAYLKFDIGTLFRRIFEHFGGDTIQIDTAQKEIQSMLLQYTSENQVRFEFNFKRLENVDDIL